MNIDVDLSIIIVSFNERDLVLDCLASIRAAELEISHEVILVDNGSTDNSVDTAVKAYGERINLIRNDRNLGFARGNNQAFERARGEWVFLLNNDAVAEPDTISQLMTFAADKPKVGMLACPCRNGPPLKHPHYLTESQTFSWS